MFITTVFLASTKLVKIRLIHIRPKIKKATFYSKVAFSIFLEVNTIFYSKNHLPLMDP
jgi:hypothetical protein